jgi:hypothetical protein
MEYVLFWITIDFFGQNFGSMPLGKFNLEKNQQTCNQCLVFHVLVLKVMLMLQNI